MDLNLYFYRTETPSTKEGVSILKKWKESLFLDILNQHTALKLEKMHNFIYENYNNRNEIKNSKNIIYFIYDIFFEMYERNNSLDVIKLVKNFDNFMFEHKDIFFSDDEELIMLYLNIFIETN
jgi:hypothetical protein